MKTEGNSDKKSAATVQAEHVQAGDVAERPGNEPMSSIADAASRGGTRGLPGGSEGAAPSGNSVVGDGDNLLARVEELEANMKQVQAKLRHM